MKRYWIQRRADKTRWLRVSAADFQVHSPLSDEQVLLAFASAVSAVTGAGLSSAAPARSAAFVTAEQAAAQLHLHPESLRRLCREGKIDFGRSGRRLVFTPEQLSAYVASRGSNSAGALRRRH